MEEFIQGETAVIKGISPHHHHPQQELTFPDLVADSKGKAGEAAVFTVLGSKTCLCPSTHRRDCDSYNHKSHTVFRVSKCKYREHLLNCLLDCLHELCLYNSARREPTLCH